MVEGGSLIVCYRKQISNINYASTNRYEQIIKLIIQRFNIPAAHETALLISTENGRIFDKLQFDYFLTLFPNPSIVFYIRYDYNRAVSLLQGTQPQQEIVKTTIECSDIKMKKKSENRLGEDEQMATKFTPVYRMDCFIYEYPTPTIKLTNDSVRKQKPIMKKQSPRSEFVKRVKKRLQMGELKKRTIKPLEQVKRFMRL
uniref:Ribosomal RNA large subunit methyltransferase L n=1 Tax=Zeugodacus cucurbitae TaxID=28588 RepID=A0A0A1WPB4_ZEUCU